MLKLITYYINKCQPRKAYKILPARPVCFDIRSDDRNLKTLESRFETGSGFYIVDPGDGLIGVGTAGAIPLILTIRTFML